MKKRFLSLLLLVFILSSNMFITVFANGNYPQFPMDGQEYWVVFKEGYRNSRIEMSTCNISSCADNAYIVWDRNLLLKNADTEKISNPYNQYYLNDNNWVKIGTYNKFTDYATEIIASNLDIYDDNGNLLMAKSDYSDIGNSDVAETFNDHSYLFFRNCNTWAEANEYCKSLGGYLATITSQEENDFLFNLMTKKGYKNAYFGLSDSEDEGTWIWSNGEPTIYTNWHSGEPNGENSNEDYAMFYWKFTDGTWNDGDFGGSTVNGDKIFICEFENQVINKQEPIITVFLNGNKLEFDQPPVIIDGRTLVPIRAIFEAMGATVDWHGDTRSVTSAKRDLSLMFNIDGYVMNKNGVDIYMDVPAQLIDGYTMVPLRAVSEAFGATVNWDGDNRVIYISSYKKQNAFIVNADAPITNNDAGFVRTVLCNNKLLRVNEENIHSAFEPTRATFNGIIDLIIQEAGADDLTYFFYSGHGGRDGHISPTYNNDTHDGSFTITPQELINTLDRIPGTIVVILDSCYSGAINNLQGLNTGKYKILTASGASEYSNASDLSVIPNWSTEQLGKFTEVFLNGLGGLKGGNPLYNFVTKRDGRVKADYNNDNNVTLSELYQYVTENMDDSQTPTVSDEDDQTIIYSY